MALNVPLMQLALPKVCVIPSHPLLALERKDSKSKTSLKNNNNKKISGAGLTHRVECKVLLLF